MLDYLVKPVTVPMIEDALDRALIQERKLDKKGAVFLKKRTTERSEKRWRLLLNGILNI
ncbi:hypothetical protein SFC15_05855 [Shouchella clausii]